jgi:hypothetical protein
MTKLRSEPPQETPEKAGVRAAAEAMGVPARVTPGSTVKFARSLQKSMRDADIKDYQYNIVPVEAHPDFVADLTSRPLVWVSIKELQKGEYQPVSSSVELLIRECAEWGWV